MNIESNNRQKKVSLTPKENAVITDYVTRPQDDSKSNFPSFEDFLIQKNLDEAKRLTDLKEKRIKQEKDQKRALDPFYGEEQYVKEQKEQQIFDKLHTGEADLKKDNIHDVTLAKFIKKFPDNYLKITDDLFTDSQLQILSTCSSLSLPNVVTLTDNQAKILSKCSSLYLYKINKLTDNQVESLCGVKESLFIKGLEGITEKQAIMFSKREGNLALGIKKITDMQAQALVNTKNPWFHLEMEDITPKQEEILSKNKNIIITSKNALKN